LFKKNTNENFLYFSENESLLLAHFNLGYLCSDASNDFFLLLRSQTTEPINAFG